MIRIDVIVNGMMCQNNCAATVRAALFQLDGAVEADAVYAQKRAYAVFSNAFAQRDECYRRVVQAIENVGYEVVRELETNGNHDSGSQATTVGAAINSLPTQISQHQQHDTLDNDDSTTTSLLDTTTSTFELQIGGMSCAVCAGRVEQALRAVEHVRSATVVLATNRARVVVNTSTINSSSNNNNNNTQKKNKILQQRCVRAVCNAGYECQIAPEVGASLVDHARQWTTAQQAEVQGWRTLLVWSVAGTVPLLLLQGHNIPSFVVATVVQLGVGARFYKAAYKGLVLSHSLGMDALVVLGTSASYVYSAVAMTTAGDDAPTFATAAMILTFVTFGKNLEAYAKNKTARSLQALMELQPNEACRIRVSPDTDKDNITEDRIAGLTTENVPLEHVRVGDLLRVLPNTRIPTDSILVACSGPNSQNQHTIAYADESALSGEPFPVVKRVGDALFGSTMNQSSVLVVRVTATGSETVLANIVQLVRDAQGNKAAIHVLADRLAHVFAPTVVLLSFLTLVGWLWFTGNMYDACMSAISVMVVACPCSLGLATPTAVMVGTGVGATFGLLIKGGAVLENMHSINCIVMDKTGTLTSGTAVLGTRVDYIQQDDILLQNLPVAASDVGLWLAACAETQSAHPLASAIVDAAKGVWGSDVTRSQEGVRIDGFVDVPGRGVECRVVKDGWGDRYVRVGSRVWAKDGKLDSLTGDSSRDNTGDNDADNLRSKSGQIVVYVSVLEAQGSSQSQRRQIVSVIGIVDPIAKEAKSTVAALQRLGIDVWMCTGDHAVTAQSVAQQVGIHEDNVCAGVTPEGKADLVTRLQSRNMTKDKKSIVSRVGMVGDGINDAVALARADVGIAIGAGNKIAVEAADIVLVRSSLHDVVVAVHLSRVVFRRIVINFVWAMGYNIIAIPFAAGAIASLTKFRLPPEFAGLMMAFSSVSVVSSSLLLGNYKRPVILESGVFEPGVSCVEARWKSLCEALSTRLDREINYVDVPTNSDFELV